jgi:hypothetical protein
MSGPVSTNIPSPSFTNTGFIAAPESAILTDALEDINAAFGGALNVTTLSTPQGQLASSKATILGDAYVLFLKLANGVDPAYAEGVASPLPGGTTQSRSQPVNRYRRTATVAPPRKPLSRPPRRDGHRPPIGRSPGCRPAPPYGSPARVALRSESLRPKCQPLICTRSAAVRVPHQCRSFCISVPRVYRTRTGPCHLQDGFTATQSFR